MKKKKEVESIETDLRGRGTWERGTRKFESLLNKKWGLIIKDVWAGPVFTCGIWAGLIMDS